MTMQPEADFHSIEEELKERRWFMNSRGYRHCDIAACNCNSWHGGNAEARLSDIHEKLRDMGVPTNGRVMLEVIEELARKAGYSEEQ